MLLADLSLNDSGSRDAQRITLSIRLSPTSLESKVNEVCSLFSLTRIAAVVKSYKHFHVILCNRIATILVFWTCAFHFADLGVLNVLSNSQNSVVSEKFEELVNNSTQLNFIVTYLQLNSWTAELLDMKFLNDVREIVTNFVVKNVTVDLYYI